MNRLTSLITELRGSLGKLEMALNAVPQAILITNSRDEIQWCNSAFERLAGQRRLELLGARFAEILPLSKRKGLTMTRSALVRGKKRVGTVFVIYPLRQLPVPEV